MRIPGLGILFLLGSITAASAYADKKVILLAASITQKDTIGYNIVSALAEHTYQWLEAGQVVFWNSPDKKYAVKFSDLQAIEASSNTSFKDVQNLFLYEVWTSNRKKTRCQMKGITFTGQNSNNEEVMFGYLEYNPALKGLLASTVVEGNANAPHNITLQQILQNKRYDFDVVYFDGIPVNDFNQNLRIRDHAFKKGKPLSGSIRITETRMIEYSLELDLQSKESRVYMLGEELELFFENNKQEFFNYGGDKILSFLKDAPIMITNIHVRETWVKKDGKIEQQPLEIIPYVLGLPLNPIIIQDLEKLGFVADDTELVELLVKKNFNYRLVKINTTPVPNEKNSKASEALLFSDWNMLLEETHVISSQ